MFGAACLSACDARPLRYPGTDSRDGAAVQLDGAAGDTVDGGGTGNAADAGTIGLPPLLLSVGDNFSCALRGDSTAACWGWSGNGQATPPPDKLTSISAGGRFACGLRPDGSIACWGANDKNQSMPPAGPGFIQVSAGKTHACALTATGQMLCWGSPFSMTMVNGPFTELASGTDFTCAVATNHLLSCFGLLGIAFRIPEPEPTFSKISARGRKVCGLDPRDGHPVCYDWDANPPADMPTDHFTQIGVGGDFACALRDDSQIACWSVVRGQPLAASNQPPAGSFTAISIGGTHSCAMHAHGAITCWGADSIAGRAPLVGRFSDVSVNGSGGIEPVEGTHGCAQRADGTLTCWGYEANVEASAPSGVFKQVSVGLISSCGIRASDSRIVCWGDRTSDEDQAPDVAADRVAVGFGFACATLRPSSAGCWGLGWGLGATTPSDPFTWISAGYEEACYIVRGEIHCTGRVGAAPGDVSPPDGSFQQVETGMGHSCAISSSNGAITCWGGNTFGESTPPAGDAFLRLAVGDAAGGGGAHSCAIAADGHVTCWGDHSGGKCAPPDQPFARIDGAENYTCGVSAAGQVWCWGLQARQPLD